MLQRIRFEEPLVVWLVPNRHELGVRKIADVQEGRAALYRYGIEGLRYARCREERRIWAEACHALLSATSNPRPEYVSRARRALSTAARKAGALTCPDLRGELLTKGLDFAP